jgi:hypothetical protein
VKCVAISFPTLVASPSLAARSGIHPTGIAGEYKAALLVERSRRLGYTKEGGVKKKEGKERKKDKKDKKEKKDKKRKHKSKDKKKVRCVGGLGRVGSGCWRGGRVRPCCAGSSAGLQQACTNHAAPAAVLGPSCLQKHKKSTKEKRSKKKRRRHSSGSSSSSSSGSDSDSSSSSSSGSDQDYGGMGSPVRLSKFLNA